jgi:DNA-binding winged helix-turn-helix (wHTH) protein/TolB-like protein/Tfp pilus assembly protein PilF
MAEQFFEFGPFRLDVETRSLYRGAEFVPVPPKALDTLFVLVEEAGRLVTKDELMQKVWPDAFVEEGSIANNISMLRKLLNPHFEGDGPIATVARRGYRFTEPVRLRVPIRKSSEQTTTNLPNLSLNGTSTGTSNGSWPAVALAKAGPNAPSNVRPNVRWHVLVAAALALVTLSATITILLRPAATEASVPTPLRRTIVILSMQNLSGDRDTGWFSTALSEALNNQLGAGGQLRIISGGAVTQMEQDIKPQPGVGLSRKQLDEIGRNLGSDLILTGSYRQANGRVRIEGRLDDIATGGPVASFNVEDTEDKLIDLVAQASRELRSKLGLAPPMPGEGEAARAAFSSNPNALRFYFLGLEALRIHDMRRSTELLTLAAQEDPNFALAHSALSIAWRVLGHDDKSQASAKVAFDLSSKLGREDQLAVQGAYYEVMADWQRAIEKYQALWNFFPDNPAYALKLVHQQLLGNQLDDARRTLDQMRALPPPSDTDPRFDQVEADWYFRQGRFAEVVSVTGRGITHARLRKSNQLQARMLLVQGKAELRLGAHDKARKLFQESQQLFDKLGDRGGVAEVLRADGVALAAHGELPEGRQRLDQALQIATSINHQRLIPDILAARADLDKKLVGANFSSP